MHPTCANPLLLEWIKEIYDIAKERNTKGATTYKRAYDSMKACPLTFTHPSEAQQLDGIGPKICNRLTEKLKEHCEANGLPAPKKPRDKVPKRLCVEHLTDVEEPVPAKKPRKARPYVPSLRSGPYALILALSSMPEDSLQSFSKKDAIELAQPHCESSFTVPSEAGKFYTAWNSMTTLVNKDLVQERGRPLRKYTLTEDGWEIARRIKSVQSGDVFEKAGRAPISKGSNKKGSNGKTPYSTRDPDDWSLDLEDDRNPDATLKALPDRAVTAERVTENQSLKRTIHFARDAEDWLLHLEDDAILGALPSRAVNSETVNKKQSFAGRKRIANNANDWLLDLENEQGQDAFLRALPDRRDNSEGTIEPVRNEPGPVGRTLGGALVDKFGTMSESRGCGPAPKQDYVELQSSPEPQPQPDIPFTASGPMTSKTKSKLTSELPKVALLAAQHPTTRTPTMATSAEDPLLPTFEPICLQPGTFAVQLVLDNREVRTKDDREYIQDELTKKGAKPLSRSLELGDFFWVAKCKDPQMLSRYGEEGDEVALDWIVERKRLDDLVGSITDGRFQEQKFRLRKSGLKNVIYLIEEFSLSSEKTTKFHEAILSAIASTQVVNGYFVKRTQRLDETIRYLARMTRMLKTIYESKPLYLIPTSALTPTTYQPLLIHLRSHPAHKDRDYNITYTSFASLSSKSDTLTLRDVYLKMLMCTRGISGDKALAIQKVWSTPRALIKGFEACASQKEREMLLEKHLGGTVGRAKIKGVLGAKVAGVWGEE